MKFMTPSVSLKPSLSNFLKHDGPAGVVVFLVALPLCLGIALASGAPLFAGILAGVVGGLVISILSGSDISVSGPAAGLAVIVANSIQQVGSFEAFLAAVVVAGVLQLLLGVARLGSIVDYVPNSVIQGMLAAIGLVIILKQVPHALGRDQDYDGDLAFFEAEGLNTFTDILIALVTAHPGAVLVSVVCLTVMLAWDSLAARGIRAFQLLPSALVAVLLGIAVNQWFHWRHPQMAIVDPSHMVQLPTPDSPREFLAELRFPDFSALNHQSVWITAVTLALVASLESLLSLEAADKLDPYRRISSPHRELCAQGIGNIISGMVGGLPVTCVVVRTSANVYAGARTWVSAFTHGVLLLASTVTIPRLLNLIPLASLAVVLILVGYKLTKPKIYQAMFRRGWDQFLPFIATVLAVVFTDLLKGVLIGLVVGLFFVIRANHRRAFSVVHMDNYYLMRLNKDATFVNKSELRSRLREIPEGSHVVLDGTRALFIDHDIKEVAEDFRKMAEYKNITLELKNF
jgi:MFS superfamily sulfate permease-like transporter